MMAVGFAFLALCTIMLLFVFMSSGKDYEDVYAGLPTVPPTLANAGLQAKVAQFFAIDSNCREVLHLLRVRLPDMFVQIDQAFSQKKGVSKNSLKAWWLNEEQKLGSCRPGTWLDDGKERISLAQFRSNMVTVLLLDGMFSGSTNSTSNSHIFA